MDLMEAIRTRRSIRRYHPKPVSDEIIHTIIEAGKAAPSAGNLQARDFFVIKDHAVLKHLLKASPSQTFIAEAPVAIVVCANTNAIAPYGERGLHLYCLQDAAASVQNMLLAIHAAGLGSCWIGAFDESVVTDVLNLPKHLRPVAILPIGEPAGSPSAKKTRADDVHHILPPGPEHPSRKAVGVIEPSPSGDGRKAVPSEAPKRSRRYA